MTLHQFLVFVVVYWAICLTAIWIASKILP